MSFTVSNIEELKKHFANDPLPIHLANIAIGCNIRSDAYWNMNGSLTWMSHGLSLPLLIISSATGLTSAIQFFSTTANIQVVVSVFGVTTAVISALQKYYRFAERAEQSKHIAKRYERLAKKIRNMLVLAASNISKVREDSFIKFVEEVQTDMDSLIAEAEEVPISYFRKMDKGAGASGTAQGGALWWERLFGMMSRHNRVSERRTRPSTNYGDGNDGNMQGDARVSPLRFTYISGNATPTGTLEHAPRNVSPIPEESSLERPSFTPPMMQEPPPPPPPPQHDYGSSTRNENLRVVVAPGSNFSRLQPMFGTSDSFKSSREPPV